MNDERFFFTWSAQNAPEAHAITSASGVRFETSDGARWLDMGSFSYQSSLGHGHPRIVEAVCAQARTLCESMPTAVYPAKVALAEKLVSRVPGLGAGKVFFTLGGAEANENALKIARLFTGHYKAVSRYRSYHGATMGAITLSGDWRRAPVEPGIPGVVHVPDFDCAHCPGGTRAPDCTHEPLTNIPRVLELEGDVGAVFVESVVGANGVLIPPPGYMKRLREACDRTGALLVVDEVLAGFGRTGRFFGFEHFDGVVPDLITMGKAITGGYGALGGVLVHERIAHHFDEHVLVAGLTHYAHPLAVAAAVETLSVMDEEGVVARAARLEPMLRAGLEAIRERHPRLALRSRVIGLLSGTELDLDRAGWSRLSAALRKRHVHTHVQGKAGVLVLSPPLTITEAELEEGLGLVGDAIAEVAK